MDVICTKDLITLQDNNSKSYKFWGVVWMSCERLKHRLYRIWLDIKVNNIKYIFFMDMIKY